MNLVDHFIELVKIDSPTGNEQEFAKFLQQFYQQLNLESTIDQTGNLLVKVPGDKNNQEIILTAHMDTVEPGKGIEPIIEDGKIKVKSDTILGADNKAAIAAIDYLVYQLKQNKFVDNKPLTLIFTVSEESGNDGAHNLDYQNIIAKNGYSFDSSDQELPSIVISSPSYARFDAEIIGSSAHASRPDKANNSLLVLKNALNQIPLGQVSDKTLINIGKIESGSVRNTIPGNMSLKGEVRSQSKEELDKYLTLIQQVFEQEAQNLGSKIHLEIVIENGSLNISEDDPFLTQTVNILKQNGFEPSLKKVWGCYDANIFIEKGIKILNLGYGGKNAHTKDESILVSDLEKLEDIMSLLVKKPANLNQL